MLLNRGTADAAIAAAIVGLTGGMLALGGVGAAYLWYDSRGRERFGIVIPLVMIVLTMLQGALALALRLGWSGVASGLLIIVGGFITLRYPRRSAARPVTWTVKAWALASVRRSIKRGRDRAEAERARAVAEIDARTNPLKRWLRKTNLNVPQRASQRAG